MSLSSTNLENFWPNLEVLVFPGLMLQFYICRKKIQNCGFLVLFIPSKIHIYFEIYFGIPAIYSYFNASYKVKIQKKIIKACKRNHKMLNREARKYGFNLILDDHQKIMTSENI